jgi:ribosomal protein S18 acetylase RimI-like enzyme
MINIIKVTRAHEFPAGICQSEVVEFLYTHLDRFRDSRESISQAIDYCFSSETGKGGYLLLAREKAETVGVVVMNKTGMQGYIPENILVYIAVHPDKRGKGLGSQLIREVFSNTEGNIALHVEYDNPAKRLYERLGFTTKYAEMRWQKDA